MSEFFVSGSSFRDPSGFVFCRDKVIYRQVNKQYKDNYNFLMGSGLYQELIESNLLIPHEEVEIKPEDRDSCYKVIKPQRIPFISYPYEWTFSHLKDAALMTLKIQKKALRYGMVLKDGSSYNIQFIGSKPILIDTLSFEKYNEGTPWIAYKQFCQHFLAPLALMSYKDVRLNALLKNYIDGIPLDLASSLLPLKFKFVPGIIFHILLHSKAQKKYSDKKINRKDYEDKVSKAKLNGIIISLENTINKLSNPTVKTEWWDYYERNCNYDDNSLSNKKELVEKYIIQTEPGLVWDIGANTGMFSDISSKKGIYTIAFDIDYKSVENNYLRLSSKANLYQLPLLLDITNPSPSIGWNNAERMSFNDRGPADLILALALIHHLAISNNVPLKRIAELLSKLCKYLVIEFVPKEDSQVKKLLTFRTDIFSNYYRENFEKEFKLFFEIKDSCRIKSSKRILYLMEKKK